MRVEVTVQIRFFRQVADAGFGGHVPRRMSKDFNVTFGRIKQAEKQLDGRRFAGPIGTEQAEDFAATHFKIYIVHRSGFRAAPEIFEEFGEAADGDNDLAVQG